MYIFFDYVPSNPTAQILKLKLQSPSYLGAARTETGLKNGLQSKHYEGLGCTVRRATGENLEGEDGRMGQAAKG